MTEYATLRLALALRVDHAQAFVLLGDYLNVRNYSIWMLVYSDICIATVQLLYATFKGNEIIHCRCIKHQYAPVHIILLLLPIASGQCVQRNKIHNILHPSAIKMRYRRGKKDST